jgi:hypothetical protein
MVLQEFGGAMPESLIGFEDAMREFMNVRSLELQKLGMATTNITATSLSLTPTTRDELLSPVVGAGAQPAFVEAIPSGGSTDNGYRRKVEIVPLSVLPTYESSRAISFYGTPMRYRLAWDAWNDTELIFWYDPVEDMTSIQAASDLTFPANFWSFIVKKTALNLVRLAKFKLTITDRSALRAQKQDIIGALGMFETSLAVQLSEWQEEFRKFLSRELNQTPHLRRTNEELQAQGYNNISRNNPLDWVG